MTATAERVKTETPAAAAEELRFIPLEQLHESPLNPRKHYEPTALAELADSLLSSGQLTPILVRPRKAGGYEIAAGHRRLRAAKLAIAKSPEGAKYRQLHQLMAVVREMDDKTLMEVLTIENLQRDDLHPLEEAQGFADLIKHAGYDVPKIAARIGRSENYVYDRIKLLQLIPIAKKLFLDGVMEAGHAILLARLTPKQQDQTIGDPKDFEDGFGIHSGLFRHQGGHYAENEALALRDKIKAVSVRELQRYIDDSFRASADRIDPVLFPETVATLKDAAYMHTKVVHITRDFRITDAARDDKVKTYGRGSWKRADGQSDPSDEDRDGDMRSGSKAVKPQTCPHWVIGLVVQGPGREEALKVCIAKEKCHIHWPEQANAAARRKKAVKKDAKTGGTKHQEKAAEKEKREEAKREADRRLAQEREARWTKAAPELVKALVADIEGIAVRTKAEMVLKRFRARRWDKFALKLQDTIPAGTAVLTKLVAYMLLEEFSDLQVEQDFINAFGDIGVKAKFVDAIVDKAVPPSVQTSGKGEKPKAKKAKVKK